MFLLGATCIQAAVRKIDLPLASSAAPRARIWQLDLKDRTMKVMLLVLVFHLPLASAQTVPQILYYKFNKGSGTSTQNSAVPGAGAPIATFVGSAGFGPGVTGAGLPNFGSGMSSPGGSSATNYLQTGYTMNLNGISWTI
jgi:hypothetical protein